MIFITPEHEFDVSYIIAWREIYEKHRRAVIDGRRLRTTGHIQQEGEAIHIIAEQAENLPLAR